MKSHFGPYDISRELGRGAMGVVYLAVHRSLQRECALKTIGLKFDDPNAAERFIHEGQSVAKLGKHPNIVQVFDAGIIDETPYIAMEYVQGETLDSLLSRQGMLAESELIVLGRKLALALDHAHSRGLVHRDVKPANVIIDPAGEPQLLDFGIAKDLNSNFAQTSKSPRSTESRLVIPNLAVDSIDQATVISGDNSSSENVDHTIQGTPAYMAPEQADPRCGPVDARSDVYALGATLYTLASGRKPFVSATIMELLVRVVTEPPLPLRDSATVSADFDAVILMAMEKSPANRYQTALEFADDLTRVTTGMPTRARKLGKLGWIGKLIRAHRRLVGIAVAFLVFAGLLFGYFQYRSREIQALWDDIAERTAWATAQQVRSLLDPAVPMLQECSSLADAGLLPVDDQEALIPHLVARFRYQTKLSWLSYGDAQGRFTGAWRHPSGRIVVQRSWLDESGGHVREEFADGDLARLRWNDEWNYDPRTRPFYHLASESLKPVWTKPYEWFGNEGLGITAAIALRESSTDKVRGVFTADYRLGSLADFLANLRLGKQGRAYLLDGQGNLLAAPERGIVKADELLSASLRSFESILSGGIHSLTPDEPRTFSFLHDGNSYVAAMESFQPAEGLPVITVVLVPEDDIIGPVRTTALRWARLAGGIAFCAAVISVLIGLWQRQRLTKVLAERKRQMKQRRTRIDATAEESTNVSQGITAD